jgi:hypothetical protein
LEQFPSQLDSRSRSSAVIVEYTAPPALVSQRKHGCQQPSCFIAEAQVEELLAAVLNQSVLNDHNDILGQSQGFANQIEQALVELPT